MIIAIVTFTLMTYGINHILKRGAETTFIVPEVLATMTQANIDHVVTNAKWIYSILHLQTITLWSAKGCMVIIYLRITYVATSF